jgi:hypothetical protein
VASAGPRRRGGPEVSLDCVFEASLVPETCPQRFVDSKELMNKFLEVRRKYGREILSRALFAAYPSEASVANSVWVIGSILND